MKHPSPSRTIDALIGDEEQNGKQKKNKNLEEDLREMKHSFQVCRRRGLEVIAIRGRGGCWVGRRDWSVRFA